MNGLYSHEVSKFEISQCVGMSKRNGGGATHSSLNCLLMWLRSGAPFRVPHAHRRKRWAFTVGIGRWWASEGATARNVLLGAHSET